ncbi:chitin disaccharide deacetylase [Pantoea sp. LMR881]|uniref:chitin disaccharide deacetylase n=1 Tax=Pantoea sp. LMR881 TaxID=3014336 RepID=UPI0022B00977|nr:chitin disaccharide deacetylase [Pantoea sp. LMR881]MCZ4058879.1 chitin disaccharide deacetylase [Pantoea sp. LMR881]
MNKLLIVNADDFGLCKAQNYGIIDAFVNGVVTSTTAMVNAAGSAQAATLSAAHPELDIGLHFVLTTGQPLSPLKELTDEKGKLGELFWLKAQAGTLPLAAIANELECQFLRFVKLFGRLPTHIDSHHHVHMHSQLFPLVETFAKDKGIAIRIDRRAAASSHIQLCGSLSTHGFESGFYGEKITQKLFLELLDRSALREEQSLEMMCHPSFVDNTLLKSRYCFPRLIELDILTAPSLKQAIAERGYQLGSYRDLMR